MKSKSIIVFGAGAFGSAVAKTLYEEGMEVMIVDRDEELIQNISSKVTTAIICDVTDDGAMTELGLNNFDVAIISIGQNLSASIIASVECLDAGITSVYAKAKNEIQANILKKLGVRTVIYPERDIGERLGKSIAGSSIIEYIHFSDIYSIVEIQPLKSWIGQSMMELDLRKKYNMNVIAFIRGKETMITPDPNIKILENDKLLVVGEDKDILKLKKSSK